MPATTCMDYIDSLGFFPFELFSWHNYRQLPFCSRLRQVPLPVGERQAAPGDPRPGDLRVRLLVKVQPRFAG